MDIWWVFNGHRRKSNTFRIKLTPKSAKKRASQHRTQAQKLRFLRSKTLRTQKLTQISEQLPSRIISWREVDAASNRPRNPKKANCAESPQTGSRHRFLGHVCKNKNVKWRLFCIFCILRWISYAKPVFFLNTAFPVLFWKNILHINPYNSKGQK